MPERKPSEVLLRVFGIPLLVLLLAGLALWRVKIQVDLQALKGPGSAPQAEATPEITQLVESRSSSARQTSLESLLPVASELCDKARASQSAATPEMRPGVVPARSLLALVKSREDQHGWKIVGSWSTVTLLTPGAPEGVRMLLCMDESFCHVCGNAFGKTIYIGGGGESTWDVRLVRRKEGTVVAANSFTSTRSGGLSELTFQWLLEGLDDRTILRHGSRVQSLAFSPDGKTLASATAEGEVFLWNTATGGKVLSFKAQLGDLRFSPDGRILAGRAHKGIEFRDTATGQGIRTLPANPYSNVAFSPDWKVIAIGHEGKISLVDVASGQEMRSVAAHRWWAKSVAFAPNGKLLASVESGGQSIKLWDVASGEEVHTLRRGYDEAVSSVAFLPGSEVLVLTSFRTAELWNISSWKPIRRLTGSHQDPRFSLDGKVLITDDSGEHQLWDAETGREIERLRCLGGPVALAPDGKTLACSWGVDRLVKVWELPTHP
ncbi:MAG: WD40 repeat domain-containing protein [Acidobacteriota bacterium]|nr:WD40 repeat domain-containing protein [Acidobacteriota bacterium]